MHFNVAGLKDSADLDSEGLATLTTLVSADASAFALHLSDSVTTSAARAYRTIRPKTRFYELVGGFFVMKIWLGKNAHWLYPQKIQLLYVHPVGTSSII